MEIIPGVFGIDFQGRVWAYIIRHGKRFTLVDAGIAGQVDVIAAAAAGAGGALTDIEHIVLTHCHLDHAGTAAELQSATGARTYAHALDAPVIRGEARVSDPVLVSDAERQIHQSVAGTMPDAPPARLDVELNHGDTVDIGGEEGRVIHVPGHTDGSIALLLPERAVLFTGDAAAAIGAMPSVGFFNIDPAEAQRSFAKLAALEFGAACFGHGPPMTESAAHRFRQVTVG